jgi:hypothetical protein
MASPTDREQIPTFLRAATILEPRGKLVPEVAAIIERYFGRPSFKEALPQIIPLAIIGGILWSAIRVNWSIELGLTGVPVELILRQGLAGLAVGIVPAYLVWRWGGRHKADALIAWLVAGLIWCVPLYWWAAFHVIHQLTAANITEQAGVVAAKHVTVVLQLVQGAQYAIGPLIAAAIFLPPLRRPTMAAMAILAGALLNLLFGPVETLAQTAGRCLWAVMVSVALAYGISREST